MVLIFGDMSRDILLIFNLLTKIYTITTSILNLFSTHHNEFKFVKYSLFFSRI